MKRGPGGEGQRVAPVRLFAGAATAVFLGLSFACVVYGVALACGSLSLF